MVLQLYRKGLITRDISDIPKNFFGEQMSYSKVSNLAEKFNEIRQAWKETSLEPYYKVVYCDVLYMTLRRGNSYSKEAVHISELANMVGDTYRNFNPFIKNHSNKLILPLYLSAIFFKIYF